MNLAILITPGLIGVNNLANFLKDKLDFEITNNRIICSGPQTSNYLSIMLDNNIINLMEQEEKKYIKMRFVQSNLFLVEFFDFEYLKILISNIPSNTEFIVDNDYGHYVPKDVLCDMITYNEFINYKSN